MKIILFSLLGCGYYAYIFGQESCTLFYGLATQENVQKLYPTRLYGCGLTTKNIVSSIFSYIYYIYIYFFFYLKTYLN